MNLKSILRIDSFKVLNDRLFYKCRQVFTITKSMASSDLWRILYLSIFILTTDDIIGCVMSETWCQMA